MTPEPAQPAESPEARTWNGMITAPRDGSIVELRSASAYNQSVFSAAWVRPSGLVQKLWVPTKQSGGGLPWKDTEVDGWRPLLAATTARPTERGAVEVEPFGYWIEQRHADPALLRKPAYIPEPSELRTVTPLYALTPPVTVSATDQAGEVERRSRALIERIATADPRGSLVYEGEMAGEWEQEARSIRALDTQPATGRTMGGEEWKWKAALQDIAEAEAIPNDAVAFVWCRDVARAALQNGVE